MSSIFGKFHRSDKPIEQRDLQAMQNRLDHWGADERQIWHRKSVGLGHLMLYNTPQTIKETQPLPARFADIVITANARLDNRDELFTKLSVPGHIRHSIPDCRLILKAYLKWGEDCVEHLIGAFAFAIWDEMAQKLFCARDHMGIRPLFYVCNSNFFAFASEIKGLLVLPQVGKTMNQAYILDTLCSLPTGKCQTAFAGINKLPPAHALTIGRKRMVIKRYWELKSTVNPIIRKHRDVVFALREKIETAVKDRLRTIYPVGCQLDQSSNATSIAAIASTYLQQRHLGFSTYTHTMPDEGLGKVYPFSDERKEVNLFTSIAGIRNARWVTGMETGKAYLEDAYRNGLVTDQFRDLNGGLPMHHTSKVAADNRVRTLLSGFPGNNLYFYPDNNPAWSSPVNGLSARIRAGLVGNLPLLYRLIRATIRRAPALIPLFLPNSTSLLHPRYLKELPGLRSKVLEATISGNEPGSAANYRRRLLTETSLFSHRFEQETHSALSHRIDVRYPFADIRLLEFCYTHLAVPGLQSHGETLLIREAVRPLFPAGYYPNPALQSPSGSFPGLLFKLYKDLPAVKQFLLGNRQNPFFRFIDFAKIEGLCKNLEDINRNPGSQICFPYETLNSIIKMLLLGKRLDTSLL